MPLIRDDDVVRIDLPEAGEWVEVKRRLSKGDLVRIQRAAMAGTQMRYRGGTQFEIDPLNAGDVIESTEFAVLDLVVKAWSFEEPVTPENIRALDPESCDSIKERLNEIYPTLRPEAEKNGSGGSTATPSSDGAGLPRSLAG